MNRNTKINQPQIKNYKSEWDRMRREEPKALERIQREQPEEYSRLMNEHLNPKYDAAVNPDWNFRDWQKNDPKGLARMLDVNPERYYALYNSYGRRAQIPTITPEVVSKQPQLSVSNSSQQITGSEKSNWFQIVNKGNRAEIIMHGFIGPYDEIKSNQFVSAFKELEAKYANIDIDLHSGGGSVFDGWPIYNTINSSKANVSITVTGMAASMGSIVLQGAKKGNRKAYKNARIMVHLPSGSIYGSAQKLREMADQLDSIKEDLAEAYSEKTGQTLAVVNSWMQEGQDKWFTAREALAAGLIDEIIDLAPGKEPEANLKPEEMHRFFSNQFQALHQQARADQEAERANWNFRD